MAITHYKTDILETQTKEKLISMIEINPMFIERAEVKLEGAQHVTDVNGPDGLYPNGQSLEIKSQIFTNNYKLRGRGKFGAISQKIYDKKLESDETIIVIGCDSDGEIFYRFKFNFKAIADRYRSTIAAMELAKWSNYDMIPPHYVHDDTFEVLFLAKQAILLQNQEKLQPKFYKFLMHLHNGKSAGTFY